jgi:1,4-dihydroxy-2-naphthoate polyprenyltransferase
MSAEPRSVITCDLEGRIETFSAGAQAMFGYAPEEVIGKKRVSLFSPGLVVLGHINTWLGTAVKDGKFETQTVFLRKDGSPFAAEIKITPTFKAGKQIGYCGVTLKRPDLSVEQAMPPIGTLTKVFGWLVVTRAPFLTATLVPVALAAAWSALNGAFSWGLFGLTALTAALLHVAANTFNDYFDWKSGADGENNNYFLPYSGGSRSIELGLTTPPKLLGVAITSLVLAAAAGGYLLWLRGLPLFWFGLAGAASGYFYTAPPLRLVARRGLGELLVGLNFGPLMTAGATLAIAGRLTPADWLVGVPLGLFTTAILWINEFPDLESDKATGKINLVVVLGRERARYGFAALLSGAFASVVALVVAGIFPLGALVSLLAVPMAWKAARTAIAHHSDRQLVSANAGTINLHMAAGLLMTFGIAAQVWFPRLFK